MRINNICFIFLGCLFFGFIACEQDSIATINTQTAVVTGYLFAGQPCDSIRITQAISYGGTDTVAIPIENLELHIDDGENTYLLESAGEGYYRNPNLIIQSGKTYTLSFEHKGQVVSATTFVPFRREALLSDTLIEMEKIESGNFPPFNNGNQPDPIEVTWDNPEGDYYYVVVQNIEENPEYINDFFAQLDTLFPSFRNFRFISEPQATNYYNIDPNREIRQFGTHRIIVFRVNPEYAALYNVSEASSLSITQPPTNVENGLGILTGVASDTLYFDVKEQ